MSGTPENLINRVGAVAANIVRESGISTNELRGALVCFCAGVMLCARHFTHPTPPAIGERPCL